MSRESHAAVERSKRIASKMIVQPALAGATCSANPHPTGKHVARVLEFHRNGAVWVQAKCVACGLQWKERYRLDFAYEIMTPNNQALPRGGAERTSNETQS